MHITLMNSLAFHDTLLQAFVMHIKWPVIRRKYKSDKFATHEEFLMLVGDCVIKWVDKKSPNSVQHPP